MLPKIIGLIGPIRAGKSTAAKILAEKYGYKIASNSEILSKILENLEMESSRENLGKLGNSIFKVLGNDIIAHYRLANLDTSPIIIDGIRYKEEIKTYSQESTFKTIGVMADEQSRFERALTDNSPKDKKIVREAFCDLAKARSELEVPCLLDNCDALITNTGSIADYEANIHKIMSHWLTCDSNS